MSTKKILLTTTLLIFIALLTTNISALTSETIEIGDYTFEYEYDLNQAEAGERFRLSVTLTNNDDIDKTDIRLKFDEDNPFEFLDDDDLKIDVLKPGTNYSVTNSFRIRIDDDAKSQEYEIEFKLEDDEDDYDDEIDIEVESTEPELIIGNIDSVPTIIGPDIEDIELKLTVENIGGGDANFIRAKLKLPVGFTTSSSFSDISNLGTLKEGENKEISFFLDSDETLESNVFVAELSLEYEDQKDNSRSDTLKFDIPVKGKPQFEIISTETEPKATAQGGTGKLIIEIQNIGEEEGRETLVRVFENADLPIEFEEKTDLIGSLDKGESGTAVFDYTVDSDANIKPYLIKVYIRTVDKDNILTSEETVSITVIKRERSNFIPMLFIIIAVILIIVLIVLIFKLPQPKPKKR